MSRTALARPTNHANRVPFAPAARKWRFRYMQTGRTFIFRDKKHSINPKKGGKMKKIFYLLSIVFQRLRNETHAAFHDDARTLIKKSGPGALGVTSQVPPYEAALDAELAQLDVIRESPLTAEVHEKDHLRDQAHNGLKTAAEALAAHPDATKRAAAKRILAIIKHYGAIARRTYNDESAAILDILRELATPENKALVAAAGLEAWVEQLEAANAAFLTVIRARDTEVSQRPTANMKDAREATDIALQAIIDRVEAMITLNGITYTAALAPFVAEWNTLVERYKHTLAQEQGHREASKNDEL
jgi:hypothetical protein